MIDWTRLAPAVERAARNAAYSFPDHYSLSDIKQEIWVWVMENKPTVVRILEDPDSSINAVESLLVKAANTFLKKEDAQTYHYEEEDKYYYSMTLIKKILEVVFVHEDWQSFALSLDAMPKGKSDPATAGNNLASYSDVKRAVDTLPNSQHDALLWRYKYNYTLQQVGEELSMTREGARQLIDRAQKSIQRFLGERPLSELRYESSKDRRTVQSNAAWRADNGQDG